ncbi:unnamed protein product [Sphenostylis stenocarpa]|uniref:Wall-associated receptor kinase C-terminal domain-containing protein n=1 Tax=Sphenostylis stenocarpa TaxID=92480 RepID=A0AA86SCR7_9FABA|nr:unnamed protein product [Sphenostylis stenocarpa]
MCGEESLLRALQTSTRMDDKHGDFHNTLLPFVFTICCLLSITFPHSHSQPPPPPPPPARLHQSYTYSINVSAIFYPFWEPNPPCTARDPSHLTCYAYYGNNTPIVSPNFTVKETNNTIHTMKVEPTYPVNSNVCSHQFFDICWNLNKNLFHSSSVHNITIFFDGCLDYIPGFPLNRNFTCVSVQYFEEGYKEQEMLEKYSLLKNCRQRLHVTTAAPLEHYYYTYGGEVLREAISDGFEVYYSVPQDCTRCNETDGSCWNDGILQHLVSCNYYCSNVSNALQHLYPPKTSMSSILLFLFSSFLLLSCLIAYTVTKPSPQQYVY